MRLCIGASLNRHIRERRAFVFSRLNWSLQLTEAGEEFGRGIGNRSDQEHALHKLDQILTDGQARFSVPTLEPQLVEFDRAFRDYLNWERQALHRLSTLLILSNEKVLDEMKRLNAVELRQREIINVAASKVLGEEIPKR